MNVNKVSIRRLPLPQKQSWVNKLTIAFNSTSQYSPSQIVGLLDYALHLQNENPDGSVLKYAARMLLSRLTEENAAYFVRYLHQVATHHTVVLSLMCEALQKFRIPCNVDVLQEIIAEHLEYRRSDGVCWAIYLAYLAGEKIEKKCIRQIVESNDCMAMASLVGTGKGKVAIDSFLQDFGSAKPTEYEMDKYWLLIYERSCADASIRADFKTYLEDTKLAILSKHKVRFLKAPSPSVLARKNAIPIQDVP